jgi:UDP-N-acetylglucosamine transferase subunit ALG13
MILLTVGTQGPFDRLLRAVDDWAGQRATDTIFAQIGPSSYEPKHMEFRKFVRPDEFREKVEAATLVVAHAGMGSIITALEYGKQIIVMPRLSSLGEHRNDHQLATAKRLSEQGLVEMALDENELRNKLDLGRQSQGGERLGSEGSPALMSALRTFIDTGARPTGGCVR